MKVTIKEVGPRDGLQNEAALITTADKVAWINELSKSGLSYIEVTSFVNPKWIPQLADAPLVAQQIERVDGVTYAALVPNMRGLQAALQANIDEVAIFMSASETHNQKNINKSIEETLPILREVASAALAAGKKVRAYVSTVFGCPYEGEVSYDNVARVVAELFAMGAYEVSLGDTIGVATPLDVETIVGKLLQTYRPEQLALHFHNTRGTALANVYAGYKLGITTFDSSLGGLGGCPYAPGASGNVATDELVYLFNKMDVDSGISLNALLDASDFIAEKLAKRLSSKVYEAERGVKA